MIVMPGLSALFTVSGVEGSAENPSRPAGIPLNIQSKIVSPQPLKGPTQKKLPAP